MLNNYKMKHKLRSAGALFKAQDTNRCLFLMRAKSSSFGGKLGFVGGKIYPSEKLTEGLQREIIEEIGFLPEIISSVPLNDFLSEDNNFKYVSVLIKTSREFIPNLNKEHTGYAWVDIDNLLYQLHLRVKELLSDELIRESIKKF